MTRQQMQTPLVPKILFEDTHVIVLSKPSGLLSQGEKTGDKNLVDWARTHVGRNYVGLVHRLDRNTSGLMVLAKRSKSAKRLSDALQAGKLCRRYHGIVCGSFQGSKKWSHFLVKDALLNKTKVDPNQKANSSLNVKAIAHRETPQTGALTLCEFELETGRSHQIRAQSAHEGYPLLGDNKYAGKGFKRLALHSAYIKFEHPMTQELMEFSEPQTFETFGF